MKKYYTLYLLVLAISFSYAQSAKLIRANDQYNQYGYIKAGDMYNELVKKGFISAEIYGKLGDTYYLNADYKNALKAYDLMYEKTLEDTISSTRLFRYAQSLKSNNKFEKASKIIEQLNLQSASKEKYSLNSDHNYLKQIKNQSDRYEIKPVSINSKMPDYGVAFYKDNQVIFTSARDTIIVERLKDRWNKKPFFKLYQATINQDGDLVDAKKIESKINAVFHQSTPVVTKDGTQIYFTRSNFLNGKFGTDASKTNRLRIYRATWQNDSWGNIEDLKINNDNFSNAHPTLSPDEKILIFASDRPGSIGQTDLYEVQVNTDGTFGEVKNMGSGINTIGRETFPFMADSGQFYFASEGHSGLGGLDVFEAIKKNDNSYEVVNVGKPINSNMDDFGYIINSTTHKGFFATNRDGDDNIYSFVELEQLKDIKYELAVYGKVSDMTHDELIPNVKVKVYNNDNTLLDEFYTDNSGEYLFKVPSEDYSLVYEKSGYLPLTIQLTPPKKNKNQQIEINQQIKKNPAAKELIIENENLIADGSDLSKSLNLKPIYFDFDGFKLRPSSLIELKKVLQVLKDYPTVSLEVRSYTDKRGKAAHNKKLSQKRANATVDYLIKHGIRPNRIKGNGYGYVPAEAGSAEHQLSRKSEFIITIN